MPARSARLFLSHVVLLLLLTTLAACGFHLRGDVDLPPSVQRVYLDGIARDSALGRALERQLLRNGGQLVDAPQSGIMGLAVSRNETLRNVLSVDASGKASEYELTYIVEFHFQSAQGDSLTTRQRIMQVRDLFFDASNVLAKSDEESQLQNEMVEAAASQILRQLVAVAQHPEPETAQ